AASHRQGEAVDGLQHERAAPHDDGHADRQDETDVEYLMIGMGVLGGTGDGDDVVEAHGEVGHNDGFDGGQHRGRAFDAIVPVRFGRHQLDADPQQQQATQDFQERDFQQHQREADEHDAQYDGP